MALIYNASFDSQTRVLSLLDKAGNVISSCEVPSKGLVDDPNKPLMLRAIEDNSSVMLSKNGTLSNTYQTSTDGTNWTDYTSGTKIGLNKGESVYFRCSNHPTTQSYQDSVRFIMTGRIEAWHNAYSMISSSFTNTGASVGDYGMVSLFKECGSLTKAPLLLNALSPHCYDWMFASCSSLKQAPSLPAKTLAEHCYDAMFEKCGSLTQAPALPATTLASSCYRSMFYGCESLTKAPALPATALTDSCYSYMFNACQSLKEVRIAATAKTGGALNNWLLNVSATGDFYCDPNATIFPSGISGIPEGWTRRNLADYPN